jgi:GNAT superfamily N-acetyltransferase
LARVFVALDTESDVIGFYSLSSLSLSLENLPQEIARKLPRYDAIPAALIGRLARDKRVRGQGVGELLLADAIRRILGASRSIAVFAIVVDAKDDRAADFYKTFGFRSFPLRQNRLFLPASTAAAGLGKLSGTSGAPLHHSFTPPLYPSSRTFQGGNDMNALNSWTAAAAIGGVLIATACLAQGPQEPTKKGVSATEVVAALGQELGAEAAADQFSGVLLLAKDGKPAAPVWASP